MQHITMSILSSQTIKKGKQHNHSSGIQMKYPVLSLMGAVMRPSETTDFSKYQCLSEEYQIG